MDPLKDAVSSKTEATADVSSDTQEHKAGETASVQDSEEVRNATPDR
jgi:hypothetical protein